MFSESGFAIDSNLFVSPATRRLLHGIALETGKNIFLLPEVHREIAKRKRICSAEVFRWRRRQRWQKLDAGGPVEKMERVIDAIGKASLDWYEEELSRPNGVFGRVQTTDREARDVARIGEALPKRIFKGFVEGKPLEGDPLIVAQAIFHKIDLLSTNNLNTIDHDQLNAWLRSRGDWIHDLIHTPSHAVQEICQDDIQRVYQHFIAHGTLRVSAKEQENRTEFARLFRKRDEDTEMSFLDLVAIDLRIRIEEAFFQIPQAALNHAGNLPARFRRKRLLPAHSEWGTAVGRDMDTRRPAMACRGNDMVAPLCPIYCPAFNSPEDSSWPRLERERYHGSEATGTSATGPSDPRFSSASKAEPSRRVMFGT